MATYRIIDLAEGKTMLVIPPYPPLEAAIRRKGGTWVTQRMDLDGEGQVLVGGYLLEPHQADREDLLALLRVHLEELEVVDYLFRADKGKRGNDKGLAHRHDVPTVGMVPIVVNDLTVYRVSDVVKGMPVRVLQVYANSLYFDGSVFHGVFHARILKPVTAAVYWKSGSCIRYAPSVRGRNAVLRSDAPMPLMPDMARFHITGEMTGSTGEVAPVLVFDKTVLFPIPKIDGVLRVVCVLWRRDPPIWNSPTWYAVYRAMIDDRLLAEITLKSSIEMGDWSVYDIRPLDPFIGALLGNND